MTNADWWARVVKERTEHDDLLPQRVWALRKGAHVPRSICGPSPGDREDPVLAGVALSRERE